jgi:hypothetical protein
MLHNAIVAHLRKFGYHLPGTAEVPNQPADLQYPDLPWRMVWYPSKPTKVGIVSDEEKVSIPSFNIKTLERTPFGRGATRPQIKTDKRPLIMIRKSQNERKSTSSNNSVVPRFGDLLGLMPGSASPRMSSQLLGNRLHKCLGRRVMDGFYSDERDSNPSNLLCRPCVVICDPDTLLPVPASRATSPGPPSPSVSSEGASTRSDSATSPPTEPRVTAIRTPIDVPSRPRIIVAGITRGQTTSVAR